MKGPEIMKIARKLCRKPMSQKEIENISYKEMMPLQLKNSVSGKSDKSADVSCLQEMAVMFACMKKNDFKEVKCSSEIATFDSCYKDYTANKKMKKEREESGKIVSGTNVRNLTTKQLNSLLQKYPQHNVKL